MRNNVVFTAKNVAAAILAGTVLGLAATACVAPEPDEDCEAAPVTWGYLDDKEPKTGPKAPDRFEVRTVREAKAPFGGKKSAGDGKKPAIRW